MIQLAQLATHRKILAAQKKRFAEAAIPCLNRQAEHELLAAICQGGAESLYKAGDHAVDVNCFFHDLHAEMFAAIASVLADNDAITPSLLHGALTRLGCAEEQVRGLHESIPLLFTRDIESDIDALCEEVRDVADRRLAQITGLKVAHHATRLSRSQLGQEVASIATALNEREIDPDMEGGGIADFKAHLHWKDALMRGKEKTPNISTGYPDMDAALGNALEHGQIYTIAAGEKVGKSQWLMQLTTNILCGDDENVFVDHYSVEMSKEECYDVMLSSTFATCERAKEGGMVSHAPLTSEIRHGVSQNMRRLTACFGEHASVLGQHMDRYRFKLLSGETVEQVEQRVKLKVEAWRAIHGEQAHYVMTLDYGQDLTTSQPVHSDVKVYEIVSRKLRSIAKRLNIVVIVVVHSGGSDDSKIDPGTHIHGSRQWLKDTSGAMILYRPFQDPTAGEPWQWMQMRVCRTRWGTGGLFEMRADVSRAHFEPWTGQTPHEVVTLREEQSKKRNSR